MASINDYFDLVIAKAKEEISSKNEEYMLGVDANELVEYYVSRDELPIVEKDEHRDLTIEQMKPVVRMLGLSDIPISRDIHLRIHYPIKPYDKIEEVIERRASTYFVDYELSYHNGEILSDVTFPSEGQGQEKIIEKEIKNIETTIERKNNDVRRGNSRNRSELTEFVERVKKRVESDSALVDSLIAKVPIKLVKKEESRYQPVGLRVKKKILPLYPMAEKPKEPFLENEKVEAIVDLILNQGYAFETTPKVYSKLSEENLRDIILSMLNSIYEGGATGETFVKKGKTDIHLVLGKGSILSAECKIWDGEQLYLKTIEQLFNYLVWRQNYGIVITFSRQKNFTEIIKKAKETSCSHNTILKSEAQERATSHFLTIHRFPDDASKTVTIHHLLFNLYSDS